MSKKLLFLTVALIIATVFFIKAQIVSATDTAAPVRSSGLPSGTLAMGTTQANLSLNTDEMATCRYSTSANIPYAEMTNTFATTGGTSHLQLVTGLTNGMSYSYKVRCQDAAGNANTNDFWILFSVSSSNDVTPPVISSLTVFSITSNSAFISWNTDEAANSVISYSDAGGGSGFTGPLITYTTSHSVKLENLRSSTVYNYFVQSSDQAGNTVKSAINTFQTLSDSTKTVTVMSPNGGEIWEDGSTHMIQWSSSGNINDVYLQLTRDSLNGGVVYVISGSYVSNAGSYNFTIPKGVFQFGNDYRLSVGDASNTEITDKSNGTFSIVVAAPATTIPEGGLIRAIGDVDVYIVKYVGSKKFKRLILSPSVFNSYGHLHWSDIKDVDRSVVDSFTTSDLVRAVNDPKVYKLYPSGDTGQKRWVTTADAFVRMGFDWDSIYQINQVDRDSYVTGQTIE